MKDKKPESLMLKLWNNLVNKDFWLVLVPDQVNQEELTDIFQKVDNSNFMLKKFKPEKNDKCKYIYFQQ